MDECTCACCLDNQCDECCDCNCKECRDSKEAADDRQHDEKVALGYK